MGPRRVRALRAGITGLSLGLGIGLTNLVLGNGVGPAVVVMVAVSVIMGPVWYLFLPQLDRNDEANRLKREKRRQKRLNEGR